MRLWQAGGSARVPPSPVCDVPCSSVHGSFGVEQLRKGRCPLQVRAGWGSEDVALADLAEVVAVDGEGDGHVELAAAAK